MAVYYKSGNTWQNVIGWVKDGSTWEPVQCLYVKISGSWEIVCCDELTQGQQVSPNIFWSLVESGDANDVLDDGARPLNLVADIDQQAGEIVLNWEVFNEDIISHYNVYRADTSGGNFTEITTSDITTKSYTDTTVSVGETKFYKVTAVTNQSVETSFSDQAEGELINVTVTTNSVSNVESFAPFARSTFEGEVVSISNTTYPISTGFDLRETGGSFSEVADAVSTAGSAGIYSHSTEYGNSTTRDDFVTWGGSNAIEVRDTVWVESRDTFVASEFESGTLKLYDSNTNLLDSISFTGQEPNHVAVNGTDVYVTFAFDSPGSSSEFVKIYDVQNDTLQFTNGIPISTTTTQVEFGGEIDVRSDGQIAVIGGGGTNISNNGGVLIYDNSLSLVTTLESSEQYQYVSWRESDGYLAISDPPNNNFKVLNTSYTAVLSEIGSFNNEAIRFNNYSSSTQDWLAVGTGVGTQLYDETLTAVGSTSSRSNPIEALAWRPDGRIADGGFDAINGGAGGIRIFDENLNQVQSLNTTSQFGTLGLDFHDDDFTLVASYRVQNNGDEFIGLFDFNNLLDSGTSYEMRAYAKAEGFKFTGSTLTFNT